MLRGRIGLLLTGALVCSVLATPRDAEACGGTFCDSGPSSMPVDQSGENILFVMDGQNVEAHVQIQYTGNAARFAWIVPMPEVPEVSVGSQALFQSLLQGTVPAYGFQVQRDSCGTKGTFGAPGAGGSGGGGGGLAMDAGGGPTVVSDKIVGAFEVVVLQGGTAVEVSNWLTANNYQSIPSAPSILDAYVKKNYVFVAIKLTAGSGTDEIHPLVFKYPGNTPCVPLALTAVAATEDMGVRAFFLGDDRVVPTNYKHVVLNPVRIDWSTRGSNYDQVVSRAVDTPVADGHAFVTEYAGPSNVASSATVFSNAWNAAPFVSIDPANVITELTAQGLVSCAYGQCQFNHPLILPLLHQYLPVPQGMTDDSYYGCVSSCTLDKSAWDGAAFSADFQDRIVTPGAHAKDVLAKYPYLTRLFTTISPNEMSVDPDFAVVPALSSETVSNTAEVATERITCNGEVGMSLPDGRQVGLGTSAVWPAFSSQMPWAEKIEDFASGTRVVLVDNTQAIDSALAEWNQGAGWPPSASANGSGGASAGQGPAGGCACGTPGKHGSTALIVVGAVLLAGGAMKRRRKASEHRRNS